ncbi:MAG: hypothetical protein K6E98_06735 [Lachnospiraceae bacterium]|nr:hypothetical protein [Lachnospiraceae bacterium]
MSDLNKDAKLDEKDLEQAAGGFSEGEMVVMQQYQAMMDEVNRKAMSDAEWRAYLEELKVKNYKKYMEIINNSYQR